MARRAVLRLTPAPVPNPLESVEQERLFQMCLLHRREFPDLEWLFAIPNGGWRHKATAAAMQRQGVKPGVPDLALPVARGGCFGLFIEMKRVRDGAVSENQKKWLAQLAALGYRAVVCRGCDEAWQELTTYLSLPPTQGTQEGRTGEPPMPPVRQEGDLHHGEGAWTLAARKEAA
jgi:hypothetical protein